MKWWFATVGGIGDCLLETDVDLTNSYDDAGEWFEYHKLTLIIINPQTGQMGFIRHLSTNPKMCNGGAMMRRSNVIIATEARQGAVEDMDKVWSDDPKGGIKLPTMDEVRRLNQK